MLDAMVDAGANRNMNISFGVSDYDKLRNEAYRELEQNLLATSISNGDEGYDWREDLYERMELPKRQKLLSVERFIGIEFLRRPDDDLAYTQNLQRLAHFYISKFKFEKGQNFGYLGDLERADYYLIANSIVPVPSFRPL